uniref:NADH-ubiquinone oxidoreductase chain 2 n=3 Tax=Aristelliger expectatus TaxID=1573460 RepID=A0A7G9XUN4_9SAUR|nr:NADH dehydrogenase subunit 2 [Aristelliger expectatus]
MSPTMYSILISAISAGTVITMSSHHWLLAWLGLEFNTIAMLPILAMPHHPRATEAATKYFLIQAATAATILFSATLNVWQTGQWTITQSAHPTTMMMLTIAVTMKLGLAPTHLWYLEIMQGSTIMTALIISTWQKLAPLALLIMTLNCLPTDTLLMLGLLSTLIGGWLGLNQTQTRKIMASSSIAHMGWLVVALTMNHNLVTLTITIYITMTTTMFMTLKLTTTKTLTDFNTTWLHSPTVTIMMMMTLMSLGGLPPLTGFMPKLLIIKNLVHSQLLPLATTLALASLPSLFFYTRMAYLAMLTTPPSTTTTKHKWRFKSSTPSILPTLMIMTTMILPITTLIKYY